MSRRSIAEQLQALFAFRSRPAGIAESEQPEEIHPVQTNWRTVTADETNPEDTEGMRTEKLREITPSVEAIMRSVRKAEKYPEETERNEKGQIIRIGDLYFSDGTQTEKAHRRGIDGKIIQYDRVMPVGSMLGTKEKAKTDAGGNEDATHITASNRYFHDVFGLKQKPKVTSSRTKRKGKSYTPTESRAALAEAYSNTDMSKVTFTRYPAGLPNVANKIGDNFLGLKKGKKGESGSMAWSDISTALVEREIWAAAIDELPKGDLETLDKLAKARNLTDIGGSGSRRASERRGSKRLKAANDNFNAAVKKYAA
jgi:hypothetical protein